MADAAEKLRGILRGKYIELEREPRLQDGEIVTLQVQVTRGRGEGIRRSAGGWADDAEGLDEALAEMRRSRHAERGSTGQ